MSDDDGAKGSGEDEKRPETAADRRARRRAERAEAKEPAAVGAGKGGSSPAKRKGSGGAGSTDDERVSFPKRVVRYLRQVVDELRKVIWPTRKQMVTYTIVVLAFLAFMIALVWGLDWVLGQGVFTLFGE